MVFGYSICNFGFLGGVVNDRLEVYIWDDWDIYLCDFYGFYFYGYWEKGDGEDIEKGWIFDILVYYRYF